MSPEQLKAALQRKYGPLPLWGWGAIALGALLLWRWRQAAKGTVASNPSVSGDWGYSDSDYGSDSGFSGSAGGSAGSDPYPNDQGSDVAPVAGRTGGGMGCPAGYRWSTVQRRCLKIVNSTPNPIPSNPRNDTTPQTGGYGCPSGYTWDTALKKCVPLPTTVSGKTTQTNQETSPVAIAASVPDRTTLYGDRNYSYPVATTAPKTTVTTTSVWGDRSRY